MRPFLFLLGAALVNAGTYARKYSGGKAVTSGGGAVTGAKVGHVEASDDERYLRVTEKGGKTNRKILLEA